MKAVARVRGDRAEAGETLLEVLIASALMGLVVVAIVGGLATVFLGARVHREQTDGNTSLIAAMEYLKRPPSNAADPTTGVARSCDSHNKAQYLAGLTSAGLATNITIQSVEYETIVTSNGTPQVVWSTLPGDCSLTSVFSLQRITLEYKSTDGHVGSAACSASVARPDCLSFVKGDV